MKIVIGSITTTAKLWILEHLCTGIILGLDWLSSDTYRANINFENNSLSICFNNKRSSTTLLKINSNQNYRVRTCDKLILNSMEEKIIEVKVIDLPNHDTVQFTPTPRFLHEDSILMPHALIKVKNYKALMTIANLSKKPRIINQNTPIGTIEIESPNSSCFSISSISPEPQQQQQLISTEDKKIPIQVKKTIDEMTQHLNKEQQQSLLSILYQHHELFDTSVPKIANTHIQHTIPTGNNHPVNSKPYRLNPEKQQIMDNEIQSMHAAGLIRQSQSEWSSPVVLEHCEHLNNVLSVLNKANFQVNPPKCSFVKSEMDYLGHTINCHGFKPLHTNIDAIMKTPTPRTAKQVHSFLQMANFYRKFIHNFTELTRPLRPFQQKNMKFYWGDSEQLAWNGLKTALTTPPVFLNFPQYDIKTKKKFPYILSTDASNFGIAGALKQQTSDGLKPIVYISRTLNAAERNYSTFERECLGITWSVTKLRDYLADESFVIETDQQPARNIHLNRSSTNRRVNNWKLHLQDYDIIEIKHKPGTRNCDADYMSRHPLINKEEINDELDGMCVVMTRSKTKQLNTTINQSLTTSPSSTTSGATQHLSPLDPYRLKHEQNNDQEIQQLILECKSKQKSTYSIIKGVLHTQLNNGKYVPIIPVALRKEILHSFHDHPTAGHFGRDKTWYRLKDRCSWRNIRQDVILYIQSCSACAKHNVRRHKPSGQMQLIEPPGEVFDLVQMDFTGPLKTSTNGNRYVISMTDYLSKYVISRAVSDDSAQTAAEFLVDISLEFGPPHQLQTDRGSHFTSIVFEQIAKKMGCVHTVSTPYHPQSQGVIERFNATFKQQLAKYTNEHYDDWDDYLQTVVASYNSAVHQVTQFTPFQIFHKRKSVSVFDPARKHITIPRVNDYWNYFLQFEKIYMVQVRRNIRHQQLQTKRRFDRNRPNIQFVIGQPVFIIKPGIHPAFGELYGGPYTIIKQLGPQTFDVVDNYDKVKRVHSSQLKPFIERE
ncbi:unnamed protein product [Adineta steineri]|uniref:Integrase catalytic domain-containing protein n=1 Tax=Adineta steineri TaxID=433720 RepID=A0A815B9K8_9BILA|nr:unnamed protein product [Adineta steineri]